MTRPFDADQDPRRSAGSHSFVPLILITLGVVFLLGNFIPERGRGGLIAFGLGVAFLVGRVTTGRYGYAVPAGLLMAIGAYIGLQEFQVPQGNRGPGLFFILLGVGFLLTYVIGLRPNAIWPLFPAVILVCLGLVLFGAGLLGPLASFSWITGYWPVVLVLIGLWLLFRDHLPLSVRRPIGTIGGIALLAYGLLAAASTVAAGGAFARNGFGLGGMSETTQLESAIAPGQTLTVANTGGTTTIHGGTGSTVHLVATSHYGFGGHPQQVTLTPDASGNVSLAAPQAAGVRFSTPAWVDYEIDVPSDVAVNVRSTSGDISISGINNPVQVDATTGDVTLSELGGDVRVNTSRGDVKATQVARLSQVKTTSGDVSVEARFASPSQIETTSGDVRVKLLPDSAVRLDVQTANGDIKPSSGLSLANTQTDRKHLTGTYGTPADNALLSIRTANGDVTLDR